ncbi:MAG: exodeoxyribonuclease VII large subunit, partial [Armatimonadia bacterium]
CDFVADVRAATPSAAAELVAPDVLELQRHLGALDRHLREGLRGHVDRARRQLQRVASHPLLQRPGAIVEARAQRLDEAVAGLSAGVETVLDAGHRRLERAVVGLAAMSPLAVLSRGYAIVRKEAGGLVVRSVSEVAAGEKLRVTVGDGEFGALTASSE